MTALPLTAVPRARPRPVGAVRALLFTGLFAAALLPRAGFLARSFESDSGLYVYMGKALLEGQTLYRDFYETKPPGVALFTAGLYAMFGNAWWPYVALQAAMTLSAAWLLGRAVARHTDEQGGRGAFWFALIFLNFSPAAYRGFQLETVQACLAVVAGYFALRSPTTTTPARRQARGFIPGCTRDQVLVGLLAGAAAMLKPTGAAVAGAHILMLLWARNWRAVAIVTIGLVTVPAAVAAWTWRAGLIGDMPALFREISHYGRETPLVTLDLLKPLTVLVIAGFPFLAARVFRRTAGRGPQADRINGVATFALIWLTLEVVGVFVQRRLYAYHFLVLAPPLAVLFGTVWRATRTRAHLAAFVPVLAISLGCSVPDFATLLRGPQPLPESAYLATHAAPTDRIVGDGIERLLIETRLRCGARYAHLFYLTNHDAAPLEYARRFLEDLDRHQPEWAVFDTRRDELHRRNCEDLPMLSERPARRDNYLAAWRDIDAYLARHYRPVADLNGKTIYRRI